MLLMYKLSKKGKLFKATLGALLVLLVLGAVFFIARQDDNQTTRQNTEDIQQAEAPIVENNAEELEKKEEPEPQPEPQPEPEPEPQWPVTYTLEQSASLTVVVNKKHRLPSSYAPSLATAAGAQLRPEAASALQSLLAAAEAAGRQMTVLSAYRSYQTQVSTHNYWVDVDGQAQADRSSARPGHSEHQTGLAVDLGMPDGSCRLEICFGSTPQGQWLAANAHKYGFIIRYPDGKESLTGYQYEPWHLRFVGVEAATAIKNSGQTMDQYYGVTAGGYN